MKKPARAYASSIAHQALERSAISRRRGNAGAVPSKLPAASTHSRPLLGRNSSASLKLDCVL